MNVYVGCADGKLYSISQTGTIKSLAVGDGVASKTFGAIVDPPLVDGVNAFVYAISGSANAGANGALVQARVDFSSSVAVPIGNGNQCNIHAPTLNDAYFTSPTSAGSLIVIGGDTGTVGPCTAAGATGGSAVLYGATFGAGGVLNAGAPANSLTSGNSVGSEYAPMADFFNSNIGTGQDTLFVSLLRNNTHGGFDNLYTFNITAGWNATVQHNIVEGLGVSGMVVDNNSTSGEASSIYFNSLSQNATCSSPQTGANTNGAPSSSRRPTSIESNRAQMTPIRDQGPLDKPQIGPSVKAKRPYQKPSFQFEKVFETMALACGKLHATQHQCRFNRRNS